MISSGIKRGLAASAVSALAIAGLPLLASSANAAAGESFAVTYVGPALNGGAQGAVVVLRAKDGVLDATKVALASTSSSVVNSQNTADQTVVATATAPVNDATDSAYETMTLHVKVTTVNTGDTATFRVFDNDGTDATALEASEARQNVSIATSGPVSKVEVSPASQSVVQGQTTGDYTVAIKDAAGRATQLAASGEAVGVSGTGVTTSVASLDATALERGIATFTADATGSTVGAHDITLDGPGTADTKAIANVTRAADIDDAGEVDVVTAADDWSDFGAGALAGVTAVRVDQSSIRIDFKSNDDPMVDKNSTAIMTVTGHGLTFGGKPSTTVSTVLDDNGVGSVTITPDAGTVQDGDYITTTGSFVQEFDFARAQVTSVKPSAALTFSKLDGSADVTGTVLDQFGLPVTQGFLSAARTGVNNDTPATTQKKALGSNGSATFTFTDKDATDGSTDDVDFLYFEDQYDNSGADLNGAGSDAKIKYTVDGMGSNFKTLINGDDTEASTYKASEHSVVPLADAKDNVAGDSVPFSVTTGEKGSAITVSVDNGALILKSGDSDLSKGKSTITDTVDATTGSLTGYKVIGTKSGLVTMTITSAHRTETAQLTVSPETDGSTARNVSVSGPAEVEHGATQIAYTAVVTDAFGNPVPGVSFYDLNIQVSGPAQFQDGDVVTNAAGQLALNVRVGDGASGPVTLKATGLPYNFSFTQFGAAADQLDTHMAAKSAMGLPASSNVGTATTTVAAPAPTGPETIVANLIGANNGAQADVLEVDAPSSAKGATVRLYKLVNGVRKFVKASTLGAAGNRVFTVADKNGKAYTKYVAVVAKTDATTADTTNQRAVR